MIDLAALFNDLDTKRAELERLMVANTNAEWMADPEKRMAFDVECTKARNAWLQAHCAWQDEVDRRAK